MPITLTTDPPDDADTARQEIAEIQQWAQELAERQQAVAGVNGRAAFLTGWLAAQPDQPAASDYERPTVAPTRRTTPRKGR